MVNLDQARIKIGILLIDGFALMSYASVIEPLRAANLIGADQLYDICHYSYTPFAQSESSSGAIVKTISIEAVDPVTVDIDYLFVIAGGDPFGFNDPKTMGWLRRLARRDIVLVGVSGGPVILAQAGLMNGYQMTVHWEHEERLSHEMPDLQIKRMLYVMDRNRLSCAGGTAPSDMMHALLASHNGQEFARQVSDWFMHTDIRADISQQKSGIIERYRTNHKVVVNAIEAMETHIAEPLNLDQIARYSGVSLRQLQRVFLHEIELPPMTFYRELRLEYAAKLLEQTSMNITEIAFATGFSSSSQFSTNFARKYNTVPARYRSSHHFDKK